MAGVPGGIPLTISQLPAFATALGTTIIPVTQGNVTGSLTVNQISGVYQAVHTGSGAANTYTITALPIYTAYTSGLGFWVNFTNDNTGPSTLNVNGLGAKAIQAVIGASQQALIGSELSPGPKFVVYDGTQFVCTNPNASIGTFTGTGTGLTTSPTCTVKYTIQGGWCTLLIGTGVTGISNANTFTITGGPAVLGPVTTQGIVVLSEDNTVSGIGSLIMVAGSPTIVLGKNSTYGGGSSWTASGTKAFPVFNGTAVTYSLV